jgi:hypothetical protein
VKTQLDAIERALMLVAISEIAWLRGDSGELPAAAAKLVEKLQGKRVSMGAWLDLAWPLAALLPREDTHPIVRAARQFVTDQGKPSELTKALQQEVVPLRNDTTHGVTVAEETLAQHELPLRAHWQRLKAALSPLLELRLLAKANLKDFSADGSGLYNVRDLTGSRSHFEIKEVRVHGKLEDHWVYWLYGEGSSALPLSPMCKIVCLDTTGRRELFLPRTLELAPGKQIELMQLTGSDTIKEIVPRF